MTGKKQYNLVCQECEKPFVGSYPKQKHCSRECKRKANGCLKGAIRRCIVCEREFKLKSSTEVRCCSISCGQKLRVYKRRIKNHYCHICGIRFKPRKSIYNKCCSRECGFAYVGMIKTEVAAIRRLGKTKDKKVEIKKECSVCGDTFIAKQINSHLCSDRCRLEHARIVSRERYTSQETTLEKTCLICEEGFLVTGKAHNSFYCDSCKRIAKAHRKRGQKRRRRAKLLGNKYEYFKDYEIFIEDDWKCRACGRKVSQAIDQNEDCFANIDHIIPVCHGGPNTMDNVQTLCRQCNLLKSDCMDDSWMDHIAWGPGAPQIAKNDRIVDRPLPSLFFFTG